MINIAVLGFGTVGAGVADVIEMNNSIISRRAGDAVRVKYILDIRDFPASPYFGRFTKDFGVIENDPEVSVVVETMGGTGAALDFTKRALAAGKSVVTSNKELVASHGYELLRLARGKNVNYLFEASVGGGIPILRPLHQCLAANEIEEIYGILNGTTNYILTRMVHHGADFADALREAQAKGYAEKDPAADVEGHDAARKICILSSLAFGRHVYPDSVPTEGITGISLSDVGIAEKAGYAIKLLGRAVRRADGRVSAYVAPHLVPMDSPIASVEGVFNAVLVRGNAVGDVMFYGQGAGKLPTASAVLADVIDAAQHRKARKALGWEDGGSAFVADSDTMIMRCFVSAEGRIAELETAFPGCEALGSGACITPAMSVESAREAIRNIPGSKLIRVLG